MQTLDEVYADAKHRMEASLHAMHHEFGALRTGRASAALLDRVMVDAYGSSMPINQVATVTVGDAQSLLIKPFDKNVIGAIEKGISAANIGLTPNNDGLTIRLNIPALTTQRREEIVKQAKSEAESTRVAIRNVRRDANDHIKKLKADSLITEDQEKKGHDEIQKITDKFMGQIDEDLKKKEAEILE
ncbi:MAG: Ribosome-recycling factor [bacterium]|nr:Ribosome-recycling factor [bacterium]